MTRTILVAFGLALIVPSATAVVGASYESFEDGLGAWSIDHHVWCYDAPEPCEWDWSANRVPGLAYEGAWSLLIRQDGIHDSGTVWVEREIAVPEGERIELAFWVFSPFAAPTTSWDARAYVGLDDPGSESDFAHVGSLDNLPGWQRYCLAVPAPDSATVWVAAGTRVAWETGSERPHGVDYISLRGATGGEPCGLLEDTCHVAGTVCTLSRTTCALAACPADD